MRINTTSRSTIRGHSRFQAFRSSPNVAQGATGNIARGAADLPSGNAPETGGPDDTGEETT